MSYEMKNLNNLKDFSFRETSKIKFMPMSSIYIRDLEFIKIPLHNLPQPLQKNSPPSKGGG
jgi:hypothetical protein